MLFVAEAAIQELSLIAERQIAQYFELSKLWYVTTA